MPPTADPAALVPHVPANVVELLAEVRAALAQVTAPRPLLVKQRWRYVGVGKTAWYRLASQNLTPRPVRLDGAGAVYRVADLDEFVKQLKTA